jgi:hypothetical protein
MVVLTQECTGRGAQGWATFVAALSLVLLGWIPRASSAMDVIQGLETVIHRQLDGAERSDVHTLIDRIRAADFQKYLPGLPAAVLICASLDADFWVTTSIAGCLDRHFAVYYFTSAGTGFTVGLSANVFAAALYSLTAKDATGTYMGTQMGMSLGPLGFNAGFYVRTMLPVTSSSDKLILFGPTASAGASFDFSAAVVNIKRL